MRRRLGLLFGGACTLAISGLAGCDGCSSSGSGGTTNDAGLGTDAGVSLEMDGGHAAAEPDGGSDGGAACSAHLPAGFTQVAASAADPYFGFGVSMALDENDDPMFAYLAVEGSVEGAAVGTCSPPTDTTGCDALYFTRWDPCAGAFTTPVAIDHDLGYVAGNAGSQVVSLAYDPSTREVGIAYEKVFGTDPNWADSYGAVWLATQKAGQSGFATQQVSDNLRWGNTDVSTNDSPALAMGGAQVYLAFTASFEAPGCPGSACVRFASSTTTPPADGGETDDSGEPPPHYFDLSYVPFAAGDHGYLHPRSNAVAIAVDSAGRPAIAAYEEPLSGYNTVLTYWRSDMTDAIAVTDTNDVQNDLVSLDLVFEGTSPRVAGLLNAGGDTSATYVSAVDDGTTTWNAAQPYALSGGLASYTSLATDGNGNEAFTSHFNGTPSSAAQTAGCTGQQFFVSASSNSGTTWSGCEVPGDTDVDPNATLTSAFGRSRIAGKYVMAGATEGNGAVTLDGGSGYSIVYYQSP